MEKHVFFNPVLLSIRADYPSPCHYPATYRTFGLELQSYMTDQTLY